ACLRVVGFSRVQFGQLLASLANGCPLYFTHLVNGQAASSYSPVTPLLAAPLYALPVQLHWLTDPNQPLYLARFAAALMTALSVAFIYRACRDLTNNPSAPTIAI